MLYSDQSTHIYTIVGNVASGKSTLLPYIARVVGGVAVEADSLFQTTDPFREPYFKDQQRWALTNEIWLTVERVKMLQEVQIKAEGKNLVVDSGLFMSWVYARSHLIRQKMNRPEWQLYTDFYDLVTEQLNQRAVIVYLDFPIPLLMQRIAKRGRDYELKYYTADYLQQLQQSIERMLDWVADKQVPVTRMCEKDFPDLEGDNLEEVDGEFIHQLHTKLLL